jgi:hypothetical protein
MVLPRASLSVKNIVIKRAPRVQKILLLLCNLTMWGSYTSNFVEIQQTWFVYVYRNFTQRVPFRARPIMSGTENLLWLYNLTMWGSHVYSSNCLKSPKIGCLCLQTYGPWGLHLGLDQLSVTNILLYFVRKLYMYIKFGWNPTNLMFYVYRH